MPPENAAESGTNVAAATRIIPPKAVEKHTECAALIRASFSCKQTVRKGFNLASAKLSSLWANSRFAEPRSSFTKVLIVAVRRCHCGVLIRGLRNLDASRKGNVFRTFRVYEKYQKYTRGLQTSGLRGRFKALPKVILQSFPAARAETGFAHKTAAKRL